MCPPISISLCLLAFGWVERVEIFYLSFLVFSLLPTPDRANAAQQRSSTVANERKTPVWWRLDAKTKPVTPPPIVCPMSIVVSRNPIEVPTSSFGARSHISGEVEAVTVANPKP